MAALLYSNIDLKIFLQEFPCVIFVLYFGFVLQGVFVA